MEFSAYIFVYNYVTCKTCYTQVLFNLASQYEACEMYTEAMSTYHAISKNKFLAHGAKVKINMGNIYVKQNNPTKAIKMYRMAMDQLNQTNRDLR